MPDASTQADLSIWTRCWWARWRCPTRSPSTRTHDRRCASTVRGFFEDCSGRAFSAKVSTDKHRGSYLELNYMRSDQNELHFCSSQTASSTAINAVRTRFLMTALGRPLEVREDLNLTLFWCVYDFVDPAWIWSKYYFLICMFPLSELGYFNNLTWYNTWSNKTETHCQ